MQAYEFCHKQLEAHEATEAEVSATGDNSELAQIDVTSEARNTAREEL